VNRAALRRLIARVALASLPLVGGGCRVHSHAPDAGLDLAAPVDLGNLCQTLPTSGGCYWFAFVDAGWAPSYKRLSFWSPDGGVAGEDPCAPCKFQQRSDIWCGQCYAQVTSCGPNLTCTVSDCSEQCMSAGRRPEGLTLAPREPSAWLARMAELEAASVPAFQRLTAELAAHRAPECLIAGARRARLDEERHARMMADLALASGQRFERCGVTAEAVRPLEAVALENAVEGCVREAHGAIVAAALARRTRGSRLGVALAEIAVDEGRHAELAWAVDRWAHGALPLAARRRVAQARLDALVSLLRGETPG
jgi:hypothetical protein